MIITQQRMLDRDQFIGHIMGGFHWQHTRIAFAFAFWKIVCF